MRVHACFHNMNILLKVLRKEIENRLCLWFTHESSFKQLNETVKISDI